jgi:hypothetical protein
MFQGATPGESIAADAVAGRKNLTGGSEKTCDRWTDGGLALKEWRHVNDQKARFNTMVPPQNAWGDAGQQSVGVSPTTVCS